MKPNFNSCSEIKGLQFFSKEICPYYCRFLHTQKDSGGASIHRIDESFPLKPSLVQISHSTIFHMSKNCTKRGPPVFLKEKKPVTQKVHFLCILFFTFVFILGTLYFNQISSAKTTHFFYK